MSSGKNTPTEPSATASPISEKDLTKLLISMEERITNRLGAKTPPKPTSWKEGYKNMLDEISALEESSGETTRSAQIASIAKRYKEIYDRAEALGFKAINEDLTEDDLRLAKLANLFSNISNEKKTTVTSFSRKSTTNIECYNCGRKGHYANRCTYVKKAKSE